MDPVRNQDASGRELMIRAIAHFKAEAEAEGALTGLIADKGLSEGVFVALREHFLKNKSDKARDRFLELFGRCPPDAVPVFLTYLAAEGSEASRKAIAEKLVSSSLSEFNRAEALREAGQHALPPDYLLRVIQSVSKKYPDEARTTEAAVGVLIRLKQPEAAAFAAKRIVEGPLKEYPLDTAAEDFVLRSGASPEKARALLKAVLTKQAKAKSKEPESNHTVCACVAVADKGLLTFVEKQPARLFYKGLRDEVLEGMRLKINPQATPEKELVAWCELLKKDEGLGFGKTVFAAEIRRVAGASLKDRAVQELQRLFPKPEEEEQRLIDELSGKPHGTGRPGDKE
jgi:hypothetical protein